MLVDEVTMQLVLLKIYLKLFRKQMVVTSQ